MTLTDEQRTRYGRAAYDAWKRELTVWAPWLELADTEQAIFRQAAEAVIQQYIEDQAARQAATSERARPPTVAEMVGIAPGTWGERTRQAAMERVIDAARHVKHVAQAPHPNGRDEFMVRGWALRDLLTNLDALDATEQEAE